MPFASPRAATSLDHGAARQECLVLVSSHHQSHRLSGTPGKSGIIEATTDRSPAMQPWFIPMFYVSGAVLGGLALPRIEQAYLDPDPDARLSVAAWVKATGVTNVCAPIALDASHSVWPIASADEIICIDMVHISPWEATLGVIKGAAAILPPTSPFYLYSPYIREGFATAPGDQAFDQSLRDRNPNWGLREPEAVATMAQSVGFSVPVVIEMPANNLSVVFRRL